MSGLRVAVVGIGHVGLVTAAGLSSMGHTVHCFDIDAKRLKDLRLGRIPFHEAGLRELVVEGVESGRLQFLTSLAEALEDTSVVFVAVPTPAREGGEADISALTSVVDSILQEPAGPGVIAIRSTIPPGTTDKLRARPSALERPDVQFVVVPEFLAEATAVHDFFHPERLVFGGASDATAQVALLWGDAPKCPVILTDVVTAELSKMAANTFLAARISLTNEIARFCDAVGANVLDVARIVGLDSRIGPQFLRAGIGYGGSCFPKDVQSFVAEASRLGLPAPVAQSVHATNEGQWLGVAERIRGACGTSGTVGILGISFKPGTDDTREAPSLKIAEFLRLKGVQVKLHDPAAGPVPGQVSDALDVFEGAHVVLLATEWPEYRTLDWAEGARRMQGTEVIDGRNFLDWSQLRAEGLAVAGVGAR